MASLITAITQPIQLCAFALFVVASLLAKSWKSKIDTQSGKRLFYIFIILGVTAFSGGLYMTWRQMEKTTILPSSGSVVQSSSGDNSPNVNSSGNGAVTVQIGKPETNPPSKPPEKKQ